MSAVARSAVTVVNAMATGKGAAIGINLRAVAHAEIVDEGILANIHVRGREYGDTKLIEEIVKLMRMRTGQDFGVKLWIHSDIPPAKGLKSSSAVANAVIFELANKLGLQISEEELVKLGVEAAKRAGVTLTGAYDDACASHFGGLVFTDNRRMEILKKTDIPGLPVLLLVPEREVHTSSFRSVDFSSIKMHIDAIFDRALRGEWEEAAFLNGQIYSDFFGYDKRLLLQARNEGAVAGLCGKGPAMFAIAEDIEPVKELWSGMGELIETEVFRGED